MFGFCDRRARQKVEWFVGENVYDGEYNMVVISMMREGACTDHDDPPLASDTCPPESSLVVFPSSFLARLHLRQTRNSWISDSIIAALTRWSLGRGLVSW